MAVSEAGRREIIKAERQVRKAETQLASARAKLSSEMGAELSLNASYGDLAKLMTELGRPMTRQRAFQMVNN